jgi:Fe2+ or Zn2+ uptake regulation protein
MTRIEADRHLYPVLTDNEIINNFCPKDPQKRCDNGKGHDDSFVICLTCWTTEDSRSAEGGEG